MRRSRAVLSASLLAIGAMLSATTTSRAADSPPAIGLDASAILAIEAQPTANQKEEDRTPVPEPASLALFGIGLSSYFALRRFRNLFN